MKNLFVFFSALIALTGCQSNPAADYPNTANFVEEYDRKVIFQHYLDKQSVNFEVPDQFTFTEGKASQHEITADISLTGIENERLVLKDAESWLELVPHQELEGQWILRGTPPAGTLDTLKTELHLEPGSGSDPVMAEVLEKYFYEAIHKTVYVHTKESGE